jgi:hypothetical protein
MSKVWVNAIGEELKVHNTDPAALQALRSCGFVPADEEEYEAPIARRTRTTVLEPEEDLDDEPVDERPVRRKRPPRKKVG